MDATRFWSKTRVVASLLLIVATLGAGRIPVGGPGIALPAQAGRITLTVSNMSVRDVLFKLSNSFNVNIAVSPEVRGNVTARLANARLDEALAVVLSPLGIPYSRYGASIIVGRGGPAGAGTFSGRTAAQAFRVAATPALSAVTLVHADASRVASDLRSLNPGLSVAAGPNNVLMINTTPERLSQVQSYIAGIDGPSTTLAGSIYLADNSGSSTVRFSQLYRLKYLDAKSVATLIKKTFSSIEVSVEPAINGLSIVATAPEHQRIADALAQLDVPSAASSVQQQQQTQNQPNTATFGASGTPDYGSSGVDVVTLKAALPGANGAQSTSATDIATAVTQALQPSLPDLRITVYANQTQLLVAGSPNSIRIARQLIDKLDTLPKLVVLDTAIYEVDASAAKDLGLSFPTGGAVLSTTYSETTPSGPASGNGTPPPLLGLQPFTRTPLQISIRLGLLIQQGKGKVLADPKLTTISGRTASIRAGDNVAILTTTGGAVGTVATTQLQTFQTGVTLDITPVINANNYITVTMHPTVNNNTGFINGVPQISTRDAQTTVAMQEGQTLVIGGLIQETNTNTKSKIPLLGDLPYVGDVFRNTNINYQRNELIITVTPHVIDPGMPQPILAPAYASIPTATPLPTLAPNARLKIPSGPPSPSPATPAPVQQTFVAVPDSGAQTPVAPYGPQPNAGPIAPSPGPGRQGNSVQGQPPSNPQQSAAPSNAFVFGTRPASVPASAPGDPPKILYALVSPTVTRSGTPQQIDLVTSTNVARVTIAYGAYTTQLQSSGQGLWQATIPFSMSTFQNSTLQVPMTITATRSDGVSTAINVPITYMP